MKCPQCISTKNRYRNGTFFRKSDSRYIQRFYCRGCQSHYSHASRADAYHHNKRKVNFKLMELLSSNMSLRRAALILNISRTTVDRKLKYLGKYCRKYHHIKMKKVAQSTHIQFDELITIEHTKLKPLAVAVVIDSKRRGILGVEVSPMPASGHLSRLAKKKYGHRMDLRKDGLHQVFKKTKDWIVDTAEFKSDECTFYETEVSAHFPKAKYIQYKGEKAAVAGQGELKKQVMDPIFMINHTLAMLRANINRLIRKTWCTTKDPDRLKDHLDIFLWAFNNGRKFYFV
jgi:transposase-like protein